MIRSLHIPLKGRLAQLETSQGCISYQDPNTGLWLADSNTPCNFGDGSSYDQPFPAGDPGEAQALSDFAAATVAATNSKALNSQSLNPSGSTTPQSAQQGFPIVGSTSSGVSLPIPGLGLGPNVNPPTWLYWAVGIVAGIVVYEVVK